MNRRLADGLWAIAKDGDVHLGILAGDLAQGWTAEFVVLERRSLPAIVRRLNLGGVWSNGEVSISVAGGLTRIQVTGGPTADLDEATTARLQIACAHVRAGVSARSLHLEMPMKVDADRRHLSVREPIGSGQIRGWASIQAIGMGAVRVSTPTTHGPFVVDLPGLPVLVAAAEAVTDEVTLTIGVPTIEGKTMTLILDGPTAHQAAAEAQWLLPAFQRRFESQH